MRSYTDLLNPDPAACDPITIYNGHIYSAKTGQPVEISARTGRAKRAYTKRAGEKKGDDSEKKDGKAKKPSPAKKPTPKKSKSKGNRSDVVDRVEYFEDHPARAAVVGRVYPAPFPRLSNDYYARVALQSGGTAPRGAPTPPGRHQSVRADAAAPSPHSLCLGLE